MKKFKISNLSEVANALNHGKLDIKDIEDLFINSYGKVNFKKDYVVLKKKNNNKK